MNLGYPASLEMNPGYPASWSQAAGASEWSSKPANIPPIRSHKSFALRSQVTLLHFKCCQVTQLHEAGCIKFYLWLQSNYSHIYCPTIIIAIILKIINENILQTWRNIGASPTVHWQVRLYWLNWLYWLHRLHGCKITIDRLDIEEPHSCNCCKSGQTVQKW